MPEFFLECFGEEIPARFQARGAEDLSRLLADVLAPIAPSNIRTFFGPRRIALAAEVSAGVAATSSLERGPRLCARRVISGCWKRPPGRWMPHP
jgi:glycyl-tRNA synthetase beta chain